MLLLILLIVPYTHSLCPNDNPCTCDTSPSSQGRIINCRREGLTSLPPFNSTTWTFQELTLYDNNIAQLPALGFTTQPGGEGLQVNKLDLGRNAITAVDEEAFQGLESYLKELVLHVNSMDELPVQALGKLTGLEKLYLQGFNIDILPDGALAEFGVLQTLSVRSCGLQIIGSGDLVSQANSLEELDLSANQFVNIPSEAIVTLDVLTELDLNNNLINTVPSKAFADVHFLQKLYLSQNGISVIEPDAFEGLSESLTHLNLAHTKFHDNQFSSLSVLHSLQILDLNSNEISNIPNGVFIGLNSLTSLNLHDCKLSSLNVNSFLGLESTLQNLDLVSNKIVTIDDSTFQNLKQLHTLHLDDQDLSGTLSSGTFLGLETSLEYLSLQRTSLSPSNIGSMEKLSQLKTLKLGTNLISNIHDDSFENLFNLENLQLNENQISVLSPPAFRGLQSSLRRINLSNNMIESLGECIFYKFELLEEILLGGNPLHCDCRVRWLKEWIEQPGVDGQEKHLVATCSSPAEHENKPLQDIHLDDLVCATQPPQTDCETDETTEGLTTTSVSSSSSSPVFTTSSPQSETSSVSSAPTSTKAPDVQIKVNISGVTSTSFLVTWDMSMTLRPTGFLLEVQEELTSDLIEEQLHPAHVRQAQVEGLKPSTAYVTCVTVLMETVADFNNEGTIGSLSKEQNFNKGYQRDLGDNGLEMIKYRMTRVNYKEKGDIVLDVESDIRQNNALSIEDDQSGEYKDCVPVETDSAPPASLNIAVIMGSVLAIFCFIIAIVIVILISHRHSNNHVDPTYDKVKSSTLMFCCNSKPTKPSEGWQYAGPQEEDQQFEALSTEEKLYRLNSLATEPPSSSTTNVHSNQQLANNHGTDGTRHENNLSTNAGSRGRQDKDNFNELLGDQYETIPADKVGRAEGMRDNPSANKTFNRASAPVTSNYNMAALSQRARARAAVSLPQTIQAPTPASQQLKPLSFSQGNHLSNMRTAPLHSASSERILAITVAPAHKPHPVINQQETRTPQNRIFIKNPNNSRQNQSNHHLGEAVTNPPWLSPYTRDSPEGCSSHALSVASRASSSCEELSGIWKSTDDLDGGFIANQSLQALSPLDSRDASCDIDSKWI